MSSLTSPLNTQGCCFPKADNIFLSSLWLLSHLRNMFLHVDGRSRYGYCRWVTQCWVLIFSSKCHREKMLGIKAWECLWRCWLKKKVCMFANAQVDAHKRASENRHLERDRSNVIYHWRGTINAIFIIQHETFWTDNIQKCVSESSWWRVWWDVRSFLLSNPRIDQT